MVFVVPLAACVMLLLTAFNPRLLLVAVAGVAVGLIAQSVRVRVWGPRKWSGHTVAVSDARIRYAMGEAQPKRKPKVALPFRTEWLSAVRDSSMFPWLLAAVAAATIGLAAGLTVGVATLARQQVVIPVVAVPRYEGMATYRDGGWNVTDRIVFDSDSLIPVRRLAGLPGRPLTESNTIALLVDRLGGQGWLASQIGANTIFTHSRHVRAAARLFPLSTLRRLPVVPPSTVTLAKGRQLSFAPGERSQLILTTGAHVVGITAPAGVWSATATGETFQIDLGVPVGEQVDVQVQMLSPLMRNELGAALGRLTAGELVKWLVLLIAAICAEEIKQFLRELVHRLRIRLPLGRRLLTETVTATGQPAPDAMAFSPHPPQADLAADPASSDREPPGDH